MTCTCTLVAETNREYPSYAGQAESGKSTTLKSTSSLSCCPCVACVLMRLSARLPARIFAVPFQEREAGMEDDHPTQPGKVSSIPALCFPFAPSCHVRRGLLSWPHTTCSIVTTGSFRNAVSEGWETLGSYRAGSDPGQVIGDSHTRHRFITRTIRSFRDALIDLVRSGRTPFTPHLFGGIFSVAPKRTDSPCLVPDQ